MTESRTRSRSPDTPAATTQPAQDDEVERRLGRGVAIGLPLVSVLGAAVVGLAAGPGSAVLVIASGALLGAIAFLWASVRTLSGEAPLAADFESLAAPSEVDELVESKRRHLRALKDLEVEHDLGRIDDADYAAVVSRYRDDAKAVMRQLDQRVAPRREEAERLAREYLRKEGLDAEDAEAAPAAAPAPKSEADPARVACPSCGASNESDAAFCKHCGARVRERSDAAT